MHHLRRRGLGRKSFSHCACVSLAGLIAAGLAGCATRTVVLTNTDDRAMTISATETRDGWDYERTLEPGESFEMKLGPGQPIRMPGMTIQVR